MGFFFFANNFVITLSISISFISNKPLLFSVKFNTATTFFTPKIGIEIKDLVYNTSLAGRLEDIKERLIGI